NKNSIASLAFDLRKSGRVPPAAKAMTEQAGRLHAKKRLNGGATARPRAPHPNHIRYKAESRKRDPGLVEPPAPELPFEPFYLRLLHLTETTCKWPVAGEKADTLFCGHDAPG